MSMHGGADWDPDNKPSNPLAPVGLLLSVCISPLGLLLSIIALAFNPKGLAIAGVIVGLIGTAVWGAATYGIVRLGSFVATTVEITQQTQKDFEAHQDALAEVLEADGRFPAESAGLALTLDDRTDYWGNEYRYALTAEGLNYELRSAGVDGLFDTEDDLFINRYTPPALALPITQSFLTFIERIGEGQTDGVSKTARDFATLGMAIAEFENAQGEKPTSLDVIPGLTDEMRTDFWGNPYVYEIRLEGQGFGVYSYGPDGVAGGGDDSEFDGSDTLTILGEQTEFDSGGQNPFGPTPPSPAAPASGSGGSDARQEMDPSSP